MSKYIVTGGAGFIGSNLVYELVSQGKDVVVVDNLATGHRKFVDPKRFNGLDGSFKFIELDINYTKTMAELITNGDTVFLLAALPRVSYSTDFPLESHQANINGTLSVLEASRMSGAKRVVYSASSSMYGGADIPFPTPETTPAHPRSNYALQKHTGLEYCRLYSELYGLDTASLIYFNVFGKNQYASNAYAGAVPAFFSAALNDKPCRVDGDGGQSRDWTHVNNVVQANILAAEYDGQLSGEAFNIGCGEVYSVNDVLVEIEKLMGRKLDVVNAPARLGDPRKSHADITKAKEILGYEPKVKFLEGMRLTYEWWKGL